MVEELARRTDGRMRLPSNVFRRVDARSLIFTNSEAISRTRIAGSCSERRSIEARRPYDPIRPAPWSSLASHMLRMMRSKLRRMTGFFVLSF